MNPARIATAVAVALTGGLLTAVSTAPASATTSCASPVYKREAFANTSFSGTPAQTICDSAIHENWGWVSPGAGVPKDHFGVRWTVTRDFGSGGPFTLSAAARDGIRVYVDGVRKIDLWQNGSTTLSRTVDVTIPQGTHTLRIDYANWTGLANVKFSYAPRTSAGIDMVSPLAPADFTTAYAADTGRTELAWAKNQEMDLAGYHVYRRPSTGTTWTRLTTTTSTAYTDTLAPTGASYDYQVRAYDLAGNESAGTAVGTVTTVDRTAPSAPTMLTPQTVSTGLKLSWRPVAGAVSYRLVRATSADGPFTELTSTAELSYVDTSTVEDVVHYYRVTALDAAGNESRASMTQSAPGPDLVAPSPVTGVTVTPTEYGFEVRWDANPTHDLRGYNIRRGYLWGDEEQQVCSLYGGYWVGAEATSYAYTLLPDGEESCFVVDPVDDAGNSTFEMTREAQVVTATALDMRPSVPTPEGSPLSVDVWEAADGGNLLHWSGFTLSDPEQAGGYRVRRWNRDTSAYELIAELPSGTGDFRDADAPSGTTTFYQVTAVAADGTETLPAGNYIVRAPTA